MKGLYALLVVGLVAGCSGIREPDVSWHWARVHEYQSYLKGEITKEEFRGYKYYGGQPDILPSLHALHKASELDEVDLIFPNIPKSKEVNKYWLEFCNSTDGIGDGRANQSYADFKTNGQQPFRMQVWYKPEVKDKIQELIAGIEAFSIPEAHDEAGPGGGTVSSADRKRQMRVAQGDLDAAQNETERFYALNHAAKNAWQKGETEKARALATEMEGLLPKYKNDWNYGNAVQDANQVLGLIALGAGDVAEAKRRLLASADSKGSPQMNSFGPNLQLAKALLKRGEKDVVLEYFKRCATFWKMGEARLAEWTASVKKKENPDFGANLNY
jgi:hypothetical protein